MDTWAVKQLGEVCNISTGKLNANAAVESGKYPFFTCSREIFAIDRFAFDCEAILLAGNNAVGDFNVKHYKGKFNAYQRTYVITIKREEQLLYRYLYLQVENGLKEFKSKSVGAGTKFLKLDIIKGLNIPLPPLFEQRRIVSIVDQAFEGIDRAIANTQKNLTNARELFESYLSGVFTQRGSVPTVAIGDIGEVFDGPHATPKTIDSGPVFLGISSLQDGSIKLEKTRHVSSEDFQKWTRRVKPHTDDIVFSYETRLGQAAIIPEGLECCLGRRMGLVRVDKTQIEPLYFLYLYLSTPFQKFLNEKIVRGATVDRISIKEFPSFPIPLPGLEEQKSIVSKVDILSAETQRLETIYRRKLAALTELKQSILQKAFTGELTAETANQATKAVKEVVAA